jgi:hypothetical protein
MFRKLQLFIDAPLPSLSESLGQIIFFVECLIIEYLKRGVPRFYAFYLISVIGGVYEDIFILFIFSQFGLDKNVFFEVISDFRNIERSGSPFNANRPHLIKEFHIERFDSSDSC